MRDDLLKFVRRLQLHWKRILIYGLGGLTALVIIIQLLYPHSQMLPYMRIDDMPVGGLQKGEVVWELNRHYLTKQIRIHFGNNQTPYRSPMTSEIGLVVKNKERIDQLDYPWWLRLVPTSLAWAHKVVKVAPPHYQTNQQVLQAYINKELGQSCDVIPKDASVIYKDKKLQAVKSEVGGTCQVADIKTSLEAIHPVLDQPALVRIAMIETPPAVPTAVAQNLATSLTDRIGTGISIRAGDEMVTLSAADVMSWLDFTVKEGVLAPHLSSERASEYLAKNLAPKVAVAAGVTQVTTVDFVETARQDGPSGQALNVDNTLANITSFLTLQSNEPAVVTNLTSPRIEYARSYSPTDTGLSALLANFAKDNAGTFGISYIELSGQHRRATYNETKSFVTASTYKLFVAYSVLKRVDAGTWGWDDANVADGRNLATCFDDMIVKSDNACAQELLKRVGYREATNEARAIGLVNTSFISGNTPHSTAGDEALFLAQLELSQLPLSVASRDRLLGAMKRNIYRQGIPAGAGVLVADKVGFLWGLLHDAAVVYSPTGTYILVIMSDGSSWGALADLTRQIQSLRSS